MLWVLIRIASRILDVSNEAILMRNHNIHFYVGIWKISFNYHKISTLAVSLLSHYVYFSNDDDLIGVPKEIFITT